MSSSRVRVLALVLALCGGLAHAATVELVSSTETAADSFGTSAQPALSADGRYVAFLSDAPNLAPGQEDDNGVLDVFLHDRVLGTTTLVSHAAGSPTRAASPGLDPFKFAEDTHFHGDTRFLDISADGRYVAFITAGVDLVPPTAGSGQTFNVFLWDRVTGTTTLASHAAGSTGTAADDSSFNVHISADGNFLVFSSRAGNLAAGQAEPTPNEKTADVFLWSRASDTTTLVSHRSGTTAGTPSTAGNQPSFASALSADGGVVVFTTFATDLLSTVVDANGAAEVYAYQRSTDTLSLVSRSASAPHAAAGAWPEGHAVSADGRYVAIISHSAYLVPGQVDDEVDTDAFLDAFLYDRATGEMRLVSHRSLSPLLAGGISVDPPIAVSADGRYVAFSSVATDLAPGQVDTNEHADVFVYDRDTGLAALASHRHDSAATAGSGFSSAPRLSADGRFLVFQSQSADLVPGQTDIRPASSGTSDVFLYDQTSRSATLVSRTRASASTTGNRSSFDPVLSADGSVAAFLSEATDLGEGQVDPYDLADLFLYHRTSGEITSASLRDPGLTPPLTFLYPSLLGSLSADGRSVAFQSQDRIFLRDTVADTTTRLGSPLSPYALNRNPVLSADGRFAAFLARYSSPTYYEGLFLYDRAAGTSTLVNHPLGSPLRIDGLASRVALSADGRWVAYECSGCGLVPGRPSNADFSDIFLYDRLSGANVLVSRAANTSLPTLSPDGESFSPAISADGRYVAFWSLATNLFPGQADSVDTPDLFVFDRRKGAAGSIALITHRPGFPARSASLPAPLSYSYSFPANLSADGRFISFQSVLPNLVDGQVDANGGPDVFLHDRFAGTTVLVSHAASSPVIAGNASSGPFFPSKLMDGTVSMSADGRFIAYASLATDLAAGVGDTNGAQDVFLYDRLTGSSSLVSHDGSAPLTAANGASGIPRLSAEGNRVAFLSTAADLLLNETVPAGWYNLYVQDRNPQGQAGTMAFVERAFRNFPDGYDYQLLSVTDISADGRRIAFNSEAGLVVGDYNLVRDVYLWKDEDGTLPLPACKLLDTRRRADRPVLASNAQRIFLVRGACGVPDTARQVVVKVTAFNPSGKGNLRFYTGAVTANPSGILRFERGTARSETFTLPLGANGTLTILPFVAGRGTVHVAVEVTGYAN